MAKHNGRLLVEVVEATGEHRVWRSTGEAAKHAEPVASKNGLTPKGTGLVARRSNIQKAAAGFVRGCYGSLWFYLPPGEPYSPTTVAAESRRRVLAERLRSFDWRSPGLATLESVAALVLKKGTE
jgi:hypothetical protein